MLQGFRRTAPPANGPAAGSNPPPPSPARSGPRRLPPAPRPALRPARRPDPLRVRLPCGESRHSSGQLRPAQPGDQHQEAGESHGGKAEMKEALATFAHHVAHSQLDETGAFGRRLLGGAGEGLGVRHHGSSARRRDLRPFCRVDDRSAERTMSSSGCHHPIVSPFTPDSPIPKKWA